MVWQPPPLSEKKKGIMLLLHGCHHSATDMWPRSESCPRCIGLPIESKIVKESLSRGWVVVSVSSVNRDHKCWHAERDEPRIAIVIDTIQSKTGAPRRIAAIGASSGGIMATSLYKIDGIVGVVSQVMSTRVRPDHLPTRFVHMRRDEHRATYIDRQIATLRTKGIDVDQFIVDPHPLTIERFWPGPGGVPPVPTRQLAQDIFAALRRDQIIDASNFLIEDPRQSHWRDILRPIIPPSIDSLQADASPISEIFNTAYAFHEFTDAFLSQCLDWIESKI